MPEHVGAVALFLEKQLFGSFVTRERVIPVATIAAVLLNNNPERIGYILVNTGTASLTLRLSRTITQNEGIVMPNNGDTLSTTYIEDGNFPTRELSAVSAIAPGEILAIEFIREAVQREDF